MVIENELNCKTLIFPRNDIVFLKLNRYDIQLYRNLPKLIDIKYLPKYVNTFGRIKYFKKSEELNFDKLCIPGGAFINWKYGPEDYAPKLFLILDI